MLFRSGNAGRAIGFIAILHRDIDAVALRASELGPVPECRIGCSYCCHIRVEVTDPEVFRIVRRIRQLPVSEVADLIDKLRQRVAEHDVDNVNKRQSCTFLVENRCTIYEDRPATCRKAHSLLAKQCEVFSPEIPQNLKLAVEVEALMTGVSEAYHDVNLVASAHELNSAVLLALTDESAEARWYNGEKIFLTA